MSAFRDFLDELYQMHRPIASLGEHYTPPREFPRGADAIVAVVPQDPPGGDGYTVQVYECRMPARFFKLVALPTPDSLGAERPGFTIGTGSGEEMGELIGRLAIEVSRGMIGVDR